MKYAGTLFFLINICPISGLLFTTPHKIGKTYIKIWDFHWQFSALLFYYEEQLLFFLDAVVSNCSSKAILEYAQLCQPRIKELPLLPLLQYKDNLTAAVSDVKTQQKCNHNFLSAKTWSFGQNHGSSCWKSNPCLQRHLQNNRETAPSDRCAPGLRDEGRGVVGPAEHSRGGGCDWGWSCWGHAVID